MRACAPCLAALALTACAGPIDAPASGSGADPGDGGLDVPGAATFAFDAPIVQVVAGAVPSFVLLADGTVWGWTDFIQPPDIPQHDAHYWSVRDERPVRIEGLDDVVELAFRFRHGCALHGDGTVSCWGDNTRGQLATGDPLNRDAPTLVEGLSDVAEIDVGEEHSCARHHDGTLSCWGRRSAYWAYNPLKDGEIVDERPWRLEGLPAMSALSLSRLHTCATTMTGEALCWGNLWPPDASLDISFDEQRAFRDFGLDPAPSRLLHGSCAELAGGGLACACQNEETGVEPEKLPCYASDDEVASFASGVELADTRVAQACATFEDGALRCTGQYASPFWTSPPWRYDGWEAIDRLVAPSAVSVGVNACALDEGCVKCWGPTIGRDPRRVGCYREPGAPE